MKIHPVRTPAVTDLSTFPVGVGTLSKFIIAGAYRGVCQTAKTMKVG
jgi:hypothetical protein